MSKVKIGSRVGAIQSWADGVYDFYGYGVYEGEHEVPCDVMGITQEQYDEFIADLKSDGCVSQDYVMKSPRITLDDGRVIYGSQCWWAPEEEVRHLIDGKQVVNV